jgi:hypothetical protein
MIGLRELANHGVSSWEEAQRSFAFPAVDQYNIAADCLRHDPSKPALLVVEEPGAATPFSFGALDSQSARLAAGLLALGVRRGDPLPSDRRSKSSSRAKQGSRSSVLPPEADRRRFRA